MEESKLISVIMLLSSAQSGFPCVSDTRCAYVAAGGLWGTICDNQWDTDDASVVCRQLGYDGATAATYRATFGEGTGLDILMSDVDCTGKEDQVQVRCSCRSYCMQA